MSKLDKFIENRNKNYSIPDSPVERINMLAQELALGVHKGFWGRGVIDSINNNRFREPIQTFFRDRWKQDQLHNYLELLRCHGLAEERGLLTKAAFDLLHTAPKSSIFVSYKHRESSAFALLVVTRLKEYGIQAYCDMRLVPGEPWHPELEHRIAESQYLVVLLGPTTLYSDPTKQEIKWAFDNKDTKIVPITHNKFQFKRAEWEDNVSSDVLDAIDHNQRIQVDNESAAHYDVAIRTLLANRFGVTL